jgi:AICAR transformylase/IMP cyclohydrolase PurH
LLLAKSPYAAFKQEQTQHTVNKHNSRLAWKAFQHVASYDSAVSEWLWKQTAGGSIRLLFPLLISNFFFHKKKKEREKRNSNARSA